MAPSAVAKHSAMPSETHVCVHVGTNSSAEQRLRLSMIESLGDYERGVAKIECDQPCRMHYGTVRGV
jgi:hypothetical protein